MKPEINNTVPDFGCSVSKRELTVSYYYPGHKTWNNHARYSTGRLFDDAHISWYI